MRTVKYYINLAIIFFFIVTFVVIPGAESIYAYLTNISPMIYIGCCGFGALVLLTLWKIATPSRREIEREELILKAEHSEAVVEFKKKLREDPIVTKKEYLTIKIEIAHFMQTYLREPPYITDRNRKRIFDLTEKLYRLRSFETRYIDDTLKAFEKNNMDKALVKFHKLLQGNPEETISLFLKLKDEIHKNPEIALNISKKLFGNSALIGEEVLSEIEATTSNINNQA